MRLSYIIYIFANAIAAFICAKVGLKIKDWEYWGIMICIITAFICGTLE